MYINSSTTHSIDEQPSIHQPKSIDVVITTPHVLGRWSQSQEQVKALLNSSSKVNIISPAFAQKLSLYIQKTNIGAQKINGSALETFGIVITDLEVENKASKSKFFQEIFLVVDTKFEAILGMPFLKISNADVAFGKEMLI